MSKLLILVAVVFCFVLSGNVMAQADRAPGLAAALDKTKYKKKEKKNISVEVYVEVKNTPAVKSSPAEYTGAYAAENDDYRLDLRVAVDGTAEGSGHDTTYGDNQARASFTLKDARVNGAVLTATKVFADGRTEPFEAVFVNRSMAHGKNANEIEERKTAFGLGFMQTSKSWTNRVFLEAR
jgi:hypothetical protein